MKKVLFSATVDSHILNFHLPYLKMFREWGYEVHVASNGSNQIPFCDIKHNIPFEKAPYKLQNIKSYFMLKKIMQKEKYELIHCHMPMGSVITRLAAKRVRKSGTKVLYTAHGFHFYKGSPLKHWMLYYPIEKYFSRYTDYLITINQEDYNMAIHRKFKAKNIQYVRGVGIDTDRFKPVDTSEKEKTRKTYGYKSDDYILMYVAELSKRKNQEMIIKAMIKICYSIQNARLLIVGAGVMEQHYKKIIAENGLDKSVELLGQRKDIDKLLNICDLYVSTSKQEGLPVNIMEAMACNIPICATDVRGHRDLIKDKSQGYLVDIKNEKMLLQAILEMYKKHSNNIVGVSNRQIIERDYSLDAVGKVMQKIYAECSGVSNVNL